MQFDKIVAMDTYFNVASEVIITGRSAVRIVSKRLNDMDNVELFEVLDMFGTDPITHYLKGQTVKDESSSKLSGFRKLARASLIDIYKDSGTLNHFAEKIIRQAL